MKQYRPIINKRGRYFFAKSTATIGLVGLLTGCAAIEEKKQRGADLADGALENAEWIICRGVSVGSVLRRYGTNLELMEAWRVLCSGHVTDIFE